MRKKSFGSQLLKSVVFLCIALIPLFLLTKFYKPLQCYVEKLSLPFEDFLGVLVDYLSVIVAIMLGLIAYFQTKAINDLQYAQYSVFVGIEKIDHSVVINDLLEKANQADDIVSLHALSSDKKTIITFANLCNSTTNHMPQKTIYIPLVFTAKSSPLIVAINVKKISISFLYNKDTVLSKESRIDEKPYNTILKDGDSFNLCLGMTIPNNIRFSTVNIAFWLVLNDHHGRKHKILTVATIESHTDGLLLTSTQSGYQSF